MLNVKKALTKIMNYQKDYCKVVTFTDSQQTVSGYGGLTRDNLNISSLIPTGYTAVMVGLRWTGSYACYCYTCHLPSAGRLSYQIGNRESSAKSISPSFFIFCVKS